MDYLTYWLDILLRRRYMVGYCPNEIIWYGVDYGEAPPLPPGADENCVFRTYRAAKRHADYIEERYGSLWPVLPTRIFRI